MRAFTLLLCLLSGAPSVFSQVSILTGQGNISRTGSNNQEVVLTPQSVGSGNFEAIMSLHINGAVQTQPLYVSGVQTASGTINVLVAACSADDVYAFDADSGLQLWHITLLDAAHGAGPQAIYDPVTAGAVYGITGTPVIDPVTGTIYLVGKTWENNTTIQRLHALDILTGAEKFGAPTTIQAAVSGTGFESVSGTVSFDPNAETNRAGLLLLNGIVYAAFSTYQEPGPGWHGWVIGYNAATLQQTGAWNTTPNGTNSGIWMGGTSLAADIIDPVNHPFGRMFVATGNGTYDAVPPFTAGQDYGDDLVNLDLTGGIPTPQDSFTPSNQATLNASDLDLGSGGVVVLPDEVGSSEHPHLLVQASKSGNIFLVDRDNMGGYNPTDAVVEELNSGLAFEGMYGSPAYWNGNLYFWAANDYLTSFSIASAYILPTPTSISSATAPYSGATPTISANGTSNGIVWALTGGEGTTATLQAYDATNLANLLFSSNTNQNRDNPGARTKFSVPTVVNGQVYSGAVAQVVVFGSMFTVTSSAAAMQSPPGATATVAIDVASPVGSSFSGAVTLSVVGLPVGVSMNLSAPSITLGQAPSRGFSTLALTVADTVPTGSYSFQVIGTNGNLQSSSALTLNVTNGPYPSFSTSVVSFTQPIGTTSAAQTITLTNSGSADLAISSLSIVGPNAPDFSMSTSCTSVLPMGTACTISVSFTPRTGSETAMLTVSDNAGGVAGSTQTVVLAGSGQGPSVGITPSIAFGVQTMGVASSGKPVTLRNTGTAALAISSIGVGGSNGADFAVGPTTTCGTSVPAGATCSIVVIFTPGSAANESAILTVVDNAGNLPGSTQTVILTGTGGAPVATLSTMSLTFQPQNENVTSAPQTVQLTNTGTETLLIPSVAVSGPNAADFSTGTCATSLIVNKSCTLSVTFTPQTIGPESASLTITDNNGAVAGSTQTIALSGTGLAVPGVSLTSSLNFGPQPVGVTSAALLAILQNTGTGTLSIAAIRLGGANAGDFALSTGSTCGTSLAAGASCSVALTFTPSILATESASLMVVDNAGNVAGSTQSAAISGTGIGIPTASVTPTSLTFAVTTIGLKTAGQTVTVSNIGSGPLSISPPVIGGANPGDFAYTTTCGSALAAAAQCTITVAFYPTAAGSRSATLTVSDNSSTGSVQSVTLSGVGTTSTTPAVVSLSPASGNGLTQTFTATYSDPDGLNNLGTLKLLFNTAISGVSACDIYYYPVTNQLYLYNDAGLGTLGPITPGSSSSLSNSQCEISGTGTSVSSSGNSLTVQFAVTFQNTFTGAKNSYMEAISTSGGASSGWSQVGTWTPAPVGTTATVTLSPASGSGLAQVFTANYSDPMGLSDLGPAKFLVNTAISGVNACDAYYVRTSNAFYLYSNDDSKILGPLTPGSSLSLSNSQCTLSGGNSSVNTSGNTLSVNFGITFQSTFIGLKNLYLEAISISGSATSGWIQKGTWTPALTAPPTLVSLSPTSGTGVSQTFSAVYGDPNGISDLGTLKFLINTAVSGVNACDVYYLPAKNALYLYNNDDSLILGPLTPGSSLSLSNSQCTLLGANSSVSTSGNTITVDFGIGFQNAFAGSKNVYMNAINTAGSTSSGWSQMGTWTP